MTAVPTPSYPALVRAAVARVFDRPIKTWTGHRSRDVECDARAAVAWVLLETTGMSWAQIAHAIHRAHHTTAINAVRRAERRREQDEVYRRRCEDVLQMVCAAAETEGGDDA